MRAKNEFINQNVSIVQQRLIHTEIPGTYWMFSIIITACYTGSIIAFVTLPVFPDTIDTIEDLIDGFYRIGTLG